MNEIENLIQEYEKQVQVPWDDSLAGAQKVWFAIYEPSQERRLRFRIEEFALATKRHHHAWIYIDLTDSFAQWMAQHDYREAYFEQPDDMDMALQEFSEFIAKQVRTVLEDPRTNENTVVAIGGIASLFGLVYASALVEAVAALIRGRLLVFFPGRRDGSIYRLLDAREGWNYLAVPIEVTNRG